uniref:SHSP domain-containing protein n=1 Tax=Strongyloides stercoralis TaxID=6248 RepID=A0A0K0EBH0_STRER
MADPWIVPFYENLFNTTPYFVNGERANDLNYQNCFTEKETVNFSYSNDTFPELPKFDEKCPEITNDDKEFKIKMDVSLFSTDDLKVSIRDRFLQIEGKHDEKDEKCGTVQRSFIRKYLLPRDVNEESITSELTKDGILTIEGLKVLHNEEENKTISIECEK